MINRIIGMLILIAHSAAVCGQSNPGAGAAPVSEEPLAVGPKVKWDKTILEMGEIDFKVEKKGEFTITNAGNEPLLLTYVRSSCGCITLDYSEAPILPGRSTKIKVTHDGNDPPGDFFKTVTVVTNADTDRTVLQIKGSIVQK
jgi:hypothetical protein